MYHSCLHAHQVFQFNVNTFLLKSICVINNISPANKHAQCYSPICEMRLANICVQEDVCCISKQYLWAGLIGIWWSPCASTVHKSTKYFCISYVQFSIPIMKCKKNVWSSWFEVERLLIYNKLSTSLQWCNMVSAEWNVGILSVW